MENYKLLNSRYILFKIELIIYYSKILDLELNSINFRLIILAISKIKEAPLQLVLSNRLSPCLVQESVDFILKIVNKEENWRYLITCRICSLISTFRATFLKSSSPTYKTIEPTTMPLTKSDYNMNKF